MPRAIVKRPVKRRWQRLVEKQKAFYKRVIRPLLFKMDAEDAHALVHRYMPLMAKTGVLGLLGAKPGDDSPVLKCRLAGTVIKSPVGLAAGFDKNGCLVDSLACLGFGFAEIGSVTGKASSGNQRPRLFRLPDDEALINRLGLNGDGAEAVAARLSGRDYPLPLGLNIAKTNDPSIVGDKAVEDVLFTFNQIKALSLAYVTINASCPNTHDGIIKEKQELNDILQEIAKANQNKLPIFLKLSPDSNDELIEDVADLAARFSINGYVLGNTTTSRDGLKTSKQKLSAAGMGGLSGKPLKALALKLTERIGKIKSPAQQIIACGGITSAQDAYEFLVAGASQVQIYTALIYEGPALPHAINQELEQMLEQRGETLMRLQAVGAA